MISSLAAERVGFEQLLKDFRALPRIKNNLLAMHSSLSRIGHVEAGATTVAKALLEVLGEEGTLLVPTFTYSFSSFGKWPPYHHRRSPSRVGRITEAIRGYGGAIRSFHPTHSVTAVGPQAAMLTEGHLASSPLGKESPFHRLAQGGGEILLLGCDHRSNSLLHLAEVLGELPYIDIPFSEGVDYETAKIYRDGKQVLEIKMFEVPGCSRGFQKAEPVLKAAGVIRQGRIGGAVAQLFSAGEVLEVMAAKLKADPSFLLCDIAECSICPRRRRAVC